MYRIVFGMLCVMDEYSLDIHSFPTTVSFDGEHHRWLIGTLLVLMYVQVHSVKDIRL